MGRLKYPALIAAVGYVIYAIKSVVDNSHAPMVHQCVAGLALIIWFAWTVYTIDEKRRDRESKDLRFRYSRTFDDFPEEFEKFCKGHHIGATDEFARDAIKKEIRRIEKAEAGQE